MAFAFQSAHFSGWQTFHVAAVMALSGLTAAFRSTARILRNRREASMLSRLDDHMLADIGLTRHDLRDAYAEPLWRDPTDILVVRVRERRHSRPHRGGAYYASPPLAPFKNCAF